MKSNEGDEYDGDTSETEARLWRRSLLILATKRFLQHVEGRIGNVAFTASTTRRGGCPASAECAFLETQQSQASGPSHPRYH